MIRISTLAIGMALLWNHATAQTADAGRGPYQARCASCHGEDGTGGGHGPNVVDVRRPRATTVEALSSLILKGIPDAGMPAFPISAEQARAIASYFMSLKLPAGAAASETA